MVDRYILLSESFMIKKNNVDKVNVVAIDTEGFDYEVIKLIDFNEVHPDLIIFENKHLTSSDHKECCEMLESKGYKVYGKGGNTIVLNNSLVSNILK